MSFGDMTISLDDEPRFLGLPVIGKSDSLSEGTDVRIAVKQLIHSLGVGHIEAFGDLNTRVERQSALIGLDNASAALSTHIQMRGYYELQEYTYIIFLGAHSLGIRALQES